MTDSNEEYRQVKWEVVARTNGLLQAEIISGRLNADVIPARAWQEGAGEALGLTVGMLGNGFVGVPEEYAAEAREILADDEDLVPGEDSK